MSSTSPMRALAKIGRRQNHEHVVVTGRLMIDILLSFLPLRFSGEKRPNLRRDNRVQSYFTADVEKLRSQWRESGVHDPLE